ncbi:MAG: phage tail assembly protein [Nitrospirota bacterium]|nr:phage tail assembly protein [Nitrospirota bacterium]
MSHITITQAEVGAVLGRIADGEVTQVILTLSKPISGDTGEVTTLIICEPTARQMEAMDRVPGEMAKIRHLLAAINKMAPPLLEGMAGRDMVAMGALVGAFLGGAPPIGGM